MTKSQSKTEVYGKQIQALIADLDMLDPSGKILSFEVVPLESGFEVVFNAPISLDPDAIAFVRAAPSQPWIHVSEALSILHKTLGQTAKEVKKAETATAPAPSPATPAPAETAVPQQPPVAQPEAVPAAPPPAETPAPPQKLGVRIKGQPKKDRIAALATAGYTVEQIAYDEQVQIMPDKVQVYLKKNKLPIKEANAQAQAQAAPQQPPTQVAPSQQVTAPPAPVVQPVAPEQVQAAPVQQAAPQVATAPVAVVPPVQVAPAQTPAAPPVVVAPQTPAPPQPTVAQIPGPPPMPPNAPAIGGEPPVVTLQPGQTYQPQPQGGGVQVNGNDE